MKKQRGLNSLFHDAALDGRFLVEPETLAQLQTAEQLRQLRADLNPNHTDEEPDEVFPAGTVVRLKSGGPKMVVTGIDGALRECTWFDKDGEKQIDTFSLATLVMDMKDQEVPPPPPDPLKEGEIPPGPPPGRKGWDV